MFLSEAFTRPSMMTLLAKAGFSQSYTYFTWKNTKAELVELVEQLREWSPFLRPNLWPNTPDILHEYLQQGGRPAFECRLVLAATLSPSFGIYSGYEACENVPVQEGSEEYLGSEKYELKERRLDGPLLPLIRRLNEVRRAHPALTDAGLERLTWLETESETSSATPATWATTSCWSWSTSTRTPPTRVSASCRPPSGSALRCRSSTRSAAGRTPGARATTSASARARRT